VRQDGVDFVGGLCTQYPEFGNVVAPEGGHSRPHGC
jgi:hypothetical protein